MNTALDLFQTAYPDWEGAKALDLLSHYPGEPIYATTLERCLNEGISPRVAQHKLYHLAPIPMTDPATLKAVDQRINQLLAALAKQESMVKQESFAPSQATNDVLFSLAQRTHATPDSPSRMSPSAPENGNKSMTFTGLNDSCSVETSIPPERELSALIAYRRETTLPTGGIKCFGDEDTKAYRRIWAAISRLLNKAEKDGHHEAVAIVKAHLKQGKMFCWEDE